MSLMYNRNTGERRDRSQIAPFLLGDWTDQPPGSPQQTTTTPAGPVRRSGYLGLIDEYNEQAQKAYQTALGTLYRRRDYARSQLQGAGDTALRDAEREHGRYLGSLDSDLIGRGLHSTTVRDAMRNRAGESYGRTRGAIRESTARGLADLDANLTGDIATLQFANRPDSGIYSEAIAALAGKEAAKKKSRNDLFGTLLGGGLGILGGLL